MAETMEEHIKEFVDKVIKLGLDKVEEEIKKEKEKEEETVKIKD